MTRPYQLFTALAVIVGLFASWSNMGIGPLGGLIALAVLFGALRYVRKRSHLGPHTDVVTPEAMWTLVAFCSLFGGGFAALLAGNPDGYMQSRPSGAPWGLIILGAIVGVFGGGFVVWVVSRLNARGPSRGRP